MTINNGEPANVEDWNDGYAAGLADGKAAHHIAWMYEHDGSHDEPILSLTRWPECSEPWNETPLDALALAKHAIEKVWFDAVGTGLGEHSISEAARARIEFAASALKLGLRTPSALRKTGVEDAVSQRITDYLSSGGLFNPELADHYVVRDLLINCRSVLGAPWVGWKPTHWMPLPGAPGSRPEAGRMLRSLEGWKLVPVEPTPEMVDAGFSQIDYGTTARGDAERAWSAMVEAAPAAGADIP